MSGGQAILMVMAVSVALVSATSPARAERGLVAAAAPVYRVLTREETSVFVPRGFSPPLATSIGWLELATSYDGANDSLRAELVAEVRPWQRIAVRGALIHTGADEHQRPMVAVRARLLDQVDGAVDGTLVVSYEASGFRQAEGKALVGVQIGRRGERVAGLGALSYAQDPEGDDRELVADVAVLADVGARVQTGVTARARADLYSKDVKRVGRGEADLEILVGPALILPVGRAAVTAQLGVSAVHKDGADEMRLGGFALAGVGAVF